MGQISLKSHPLLDFDAETHTYRLKSNARLIPGVSEILKGCGLVDTKFFEKYGPGPALKGDAVHRSCALFLENDLDEDTLDGRIKPYLEAFSKFLSDSGFKAESWETVVFNEQFQYAGTYDLVGVLNGVDSLIDIKTGVVPKATPIQTALYDMGTRERRNTSTYRDRFALQLKSDCTYKLKSYKDFGDYVIAESLVEVYHWKKKNGMIKNGH